MAKYLSGTYTSTYTLTVIPTTVTSTGIVDVNSTVSGDAGVYGPGGTGWTLTNLGTIQSIGSHGIGVALPSGDLVINGQSGSTAGFIYGSAFGVLTSPNVIGTVINFGTLEGGIHGIRIGSGSINNSGFISGSTEIFTSGTVINSGTAAGDITLASGVGTVKNSGMILGQVTIYSGVVANYQSIVSAPGASETAIFFLGGGPGTVNNSGTIAGSGGASGITFAYGVIGAVTNSGTISSTTTAVDFTQFGSAAIGNRFHRRFLFAQQRGSGGTLITEQVACFCRGTLILTENAEVPVEELVIGDLVVTLSGEARPIRWIGRRAYDGRFIVGNHKIPPVRIAADALAESVPARDLFVSPEHALFLDGVLVPAGLLVNGATIVQLEQADRVEYFHIELDEHQIILAEGTPAETYVDCDNRFMFQNADEFAALYPADRRPTWDFCAPRLEPGAPELAAIRATILERAVRFGYALDSDPDLHLIVDGETVRPTAITGRRYRFEIPAVSAEVWLASRSAIPAETEAASHDGRRLGVAVERLVLCDSDLLIEAWHSHPALCDGFHDGEATHRWTDGLARLPDALLRPFAGAFALELDLAASLLGYPVLAPSAAANGSKVPLDVSTAEPNPSRL